MQQLVMPMLERLEAEYDQALEIVNKSMGGGGGGGGGLGVDTSYGADEEAGHSASSYDPAHSPVHSPMSSPARKPVSPVRRSLYEEPEGARPSSAAASKCV